MSTPRSPQIIILCLSLVVLIHGDSSQHQNEADVDQSNSTESCTLKLTHDKYIKRLSQTAQILYITLEFQNGSKIPDTVRFNSSIFQPLRWKRTSGNEGKGILQLRPNYDILSLSFLSFKTAEEIVAVEDSPRRCIEKASAGKYELIILNFLMKYTHDKENDEICNMHIMNDDGFAEFYHRCCKLNEDKQLECESVIKNDWIRGIDYCTYIVILLFFLYCPLLIPKSFHETIKPTVFEYSPKDETVPLCILKEGEYKIYTQYSAVSDSLSFASQPKYKSAIECFPAAANSIRDMINFNECAFNEKFDMIGKNTFASKVHLAVPCDDIISSCEVPTGLFTSFYEAVFQCKIRKNAEVSDCCSANVFHIFGDSLHLQWWILLRVFVKAILAVLICVPWVIRILTFYLYELPIREKRHAAAYTKGLSIPLHINLIYFLTPIHIVFIVSYAVVVFGYLVFEITDRSSSCISLKKLVKNFLNYDGHKNVPTFKITIGVFLKPFKRFGILGLIVCPFYWIPMIPVLLVVTSYCLFPSARLLVHFIGEFVETVAKVCIPQKARRKCCQNMPKDIRSFVSMITCGSIKDASDDVETQSTSDAKSVQISEKITCGERMLKQRLSLNLLLMLFVLLAVSSLVLLVIECVIFLIQIAVYTLIGLILNSSHAMQYISAISLCLLYYRNCFGRINDIYLAYNKAVHQILYKAFRSTINPVAAQEKQFQRSTAFKATLQRENCVDHNDLYVGVVDENSIDIEVCPRIIEPMKGLPLSDRKVKFSSQGIIMFLDRDDTFYISKKFFFEVCEIDDIGPGPLSENIIKAFKRFMALVIFLLFVFLVVMGFGDANDVSFTNQLLATVAGGFVPWLLMKTNILFNEKKGLDVGELVKKYFDGHDEPQPTTSDDNSYSFLTDQNSKINIGNRFRNSFESILSKQRSIFKVDDIDIKPSKQTGGFAQQLHMMERYNPKMTENRPLAKPVIKIDHVTEGDSLL